MTQHTIFDRNLIYHCSSFNVGTGGGIETYLASLLNSQLPGMSDVVIKSLRNIDQKQFKLLHLHSQDFLLQLTGECPAVFSVHNHSIYCPSGTKYLAAKRVPCDQNVSYLGCTWGKIVDACGSRRPQIAVDEMRRTHRMLDRVRDLKVVLLTNSDYVRRQLIQNGVSPEQTITLRYGTEVSPKSTQPLSTEVHKNHRILFAGRIVPDKGLDWLLKTLLLTEPQIQLDIAGDGWDKARMERLANRLGLSHRITWHGWCDVDKLNTLYEQCFAVIFPSVWPEPAGLITLEAYAHHRPVIASAVGGIPEHILDGETGIIVPPHDSKKLASAINDLYANYSKSRRMGEQGYAFLIQNFTMNVHLNNLSKIYEKVIDKFSFKKLNYKI